MTWILVLVTVLIVGLAPLGLTADLGGCDLARTQAVAEAALRHANEDP